MTLGSLSLDGKSELERASENADATIREQRLLAEIAIGETLRTSPQLTI
jgi:hypothetical protein